MKLPQTLLEAVAYFADERAAWAKDIVRQCQAAGVPVFVKQLGSNPTNREGQPCPTIKSRKGDDMAEWPDDLRIREFPV